MPTLSVPHDEIAISFVRTCCTLEASCLRHCHVDASMDIESDFVFAVSQPTQTLMIKLNSHSSLNQNSNLANCPHCAEEILASAIMCRFCHRGISFDHYKRCLACAELVRKNATRCRFCGSKLAEPPASRGRPQSGAPVPRVPRTPVRSAQIVLPLPAPAEDVDAVSRPEPDKRKDV